MGQIRKSRCGYEYVSDNGIVYEIGENGAEFNIIIDTFMDLGTDEDLMEKFDMFMPFTNNLVDYVFGDIEDKDVLEWIDERIERYENHERTVRFYYNEPCECYIGLKEEKYETRLRLSKEEFFAKANDTHNKVYGYCRVALANAEEITEQVNLIGKYCQDNGLKVDAYFCDDGASGITLDRANLNMMLSALQKGDVVIVKDIARLSRNASQCMALIEQIENAGAILTIIN